MTPTRGLFWHVHHDLLFEWSDNINERIAYIESYKPAAERTLRLRLMQPVRGPLPAELFKTNAKWLKVNAEWDEVSAERADGMNALHTVECPGCPWDGKTIFTTKTEE